MGILGMRRFIRNHGLSVHLSLKIEKGFYLPLAVDTWNVLFLILRRIDPDGNMGCMERTFKSLVFLFSLLSRKSCYPVFVFDGGRRREYKEPKHLSQEESVPTAPVARRCSDIKEPKDCIYKTRRKIRPPHYKLCWDLITTAGFATVYVQGMEADYACANLFHTRTVAYVLSSDSDLVFMGCDVITDLTPAFPVAIFYKSIIEYLGMSGEEFANACVDCHTNIHSTDSIYSFSARLAEWRDHEKNENNDTKKCVEQRGVLPADSDVFGIKTDVREPLPGRYVYVLTQFPQEPPDDGNSDIDYRPQDPSVNNGARNEKNDEFLSYVLSVIGPREINGRHKLLKRVPVVQEQLDMIAVYEVLCKYFSNDAPKYFSELIKKGHLKPLPSLREVICGKNEQEQV
ncbi:tegument host shutoff protein [Gallid alphaherpesvirus 1]|uniref:Virion host shutoff protein n=1 Tax=Infectious laryngotracheitis virus TaxID=10386 RepID=L7SUM5_ILTV|nr:tegument host shutoff protein [Gallid alphaherpesvirus 1]ATD84164.1 tegument host shutoff protein [Gallid alphaherpesvirus 1]ATD84322.1 tegument host shutoff protein [Gallid alphaherpesvirus 1]ATD84401.1 tegument host shutoff protein [Gallid alphaherpesvirus 1]ATD84559.1 tegument host shutoff protein [Gallid alphaherpesvirus 1]